MSHFGLTGTETVIAKNLAEENLFTVEEDVHQTNKPLPPSKSSGLSLWTLTIMSIAPKYWPKGGVTPRFN